MLALANPIKARLRALAPLTGWAVRTATEDAERSAVPAVDVRCSLAAVGDVKMGAVMLQPSWQITLIVQRSDNAADQIDAALAAVICALHGWKAGEHGGRGWEMFSLAGITEPMLPNEGLVGYELTFTTAARYMSGRT